MIDPVKRRAALIATAVTLPLVVILALVIGNLSGSSDPSVDSSGSSEPQAVLRFDGPPRADVDAAACAKVLAQLPVRLGRLDQRTVRTEPESPFVVAWGDPAVVLRCGENRPKSLKAGSTVQNYSATGAAGPFYDVTDGADNTKVFTTVDRAAYISITSPRQYSAAQLPTLSRLIAKALPPVCSTDPSTKDIAKLCTRRR